LLEIGNEERRRIGRDLQDGLGQMLSGIKILTENLARKLQANVLPAAGEVQEISEMLRKADQFTRTLSRGMVQVDLEKRGLNAAIQNLCKQTIKMTETKCFITGDYDIEIENHTMAIHIYRIIQKAISNAVKHEKAKNITVRCLEICSTHPFRLIMMVVVLIRTKKYWLCRDTRNPSMRNAHSRPEPKVT
jgi:two-component system, LuxR family, sensor kinase FixL